MKTYHLKRWVKVVIILVIILVGGITKKEVPVELVQAETLKIEPVELEIAQGIYERPTYTTRLTSYYANDGYDTGNCTSSGLCTWDFETNEKGWYTYQGKLVIATASERLGYTEMRTYNLYDELTLVIDGIEYESIVADRCGACQKHNRIDLFVSGSWAVKDTMIEVKE